MINCSNFNEYVCAYVDNELSIEERLSFDEHVKNCRKCKRELDEMTYLVGLCTSLPQQELPKDFKSELHEKLVAVADRKEANAGGVQKTVGYRYLRTAAAIAAGFFLIILAGIWLKSGMLSPAKTQSSANNTAMAAEAPAAPAAAKDTGTAKLNGSAYDIEIAGESGNEAKLFGAQAANPATAETDRSATAQNREVAAGTLAAGAETASNNFSTITIVSDDPNAQVQKINLLALENNGGIAENSLTVTFSESIMKSAQADDVKVGSSNTGSGQSGSGQAGSGQISGSTSSNVANNGQSGSSQTNSSHASNGAANSGAGNSGYSGSGQTSNYLTNDTANGGNSGSSQSGSFQANSSPSAGSQPKMTMAKSASLALLQLNYNIPQTQYQQFVSALSKDFGTANVQLSAIVTNDVTDMLNGAVAESIELDNKIQELQKADNSKNASEIDDLKKKKDTVDKRIDELRLGSDFVSVTILIKGK